MTTARRPGTFVHELSTDKGRKLQRITRNAKDSVKLRRAIVVLMSSQGQAVRDLTSLMQGRRELRAGRDPRIQRIGLVALDPIWSAGDA